MRSGGAALALGLSVLGLLAGCSGPPKRASDGPELAFVRLLAAERLGDADLTAACFTDEAVLVPPDRAPIAGREAIRAHYAALFEHVTLDLASKAEIGRVADAMAWHVGRASGSVVSKDDGQRSPFDDRYMAIVERGEDGLWRVSALGWAPAR